MKYTVNSLVNVLWKESGCKFSGKVVSINDDGSLDVVYDEEIDGKLCIERRIIPDRIELIAFTVKAVKMESWVDSEKMNEVEVVNAQVVEDRKETIEIVQSSGQNKLLEFLTNQDISSINFDELDMSDLRERITKTKLNSISKIELGKLVQFLDHLGETLTLSGREAPNLMVVMSSLKSSDRKRNSFNELLLKSHTIHSIQQNLSIIILIFRSLHHLLIRKAKVEDVSNIFLIPTYEELILSCLEYVLKIIQNFVTFSAIATPTETGFDQSALNSPILSNTEQTSKRNTMRTSRSTPKSKSDSELSTVILHLSQVLQPLTVLVMEEIREMFLCSNPSNAIVHKVIDIVSFIQKADLNHPYVETFQLHKGGIVLLQKTSLKIISAIAKTCPTHRNQLIMEHINFLAVAYEPKQPIRGYTLNFNLDSYLTQTVGQNATKKSISMVNVTVAVISTLITLQSCVEVKQSIQQYASNMAELLQSVTSNDLEVMPSSPIIEKKKGKRGVKQMLSIQKNKERVDSMESYKQRINELAKEEQASVAYNSLINCYNSCQLFATEILQMLAAVLKRCCNKEISHLYRPTLLAIVEELLLINASSSNFPITTVLLEQIIKQSVVLLYSFKSDDSPAKESKRDPQLFLFLIDIIGSICSEIRSLIRFLHHEESPLDSTRYSNPMKNSLRSILDKSEQTWRKMLMITHHPIDRSIGSEITNNKLKTKGTKGKSRNDESETTQLDCVSLLQGYHDDKNRETNLMVNVFHLTTEIVVSSMRTEYFSVRSRKMNDNDGKELSENMTLSYDKKTSYLDSDGFSSPKPNFAMLEAPHKIVDMLGKDYEEIARMIQQIVGKKDMSFYLVSEFFKQHFMEHQETSLSNFYKLSSDFIVGRDSVGWTYDNEYPAAYELMLSLWLKEVTTSSVNDQKEVALESLSEVDKNLCKVALIIKCMEDYASSEIKPLADHDVRHGSPAVSQVGQFKSGSGSGSIQDISNDAIQFMYLNCFVHRTFSEVFTVTLNCILHFVCDNLTSVRCKAMKMLSNVLEKDPSLIFNNNNNIRELLRHRVHDNAISVREEAVKIIGQYVIRNDTQLQNEFLQMLKITLQDEGISVRRSTIEILKDVLINQPDSDHYIELCVVMLERLSIPKEEESIKEIISLAFQQLWFNPQIQSNFQLKINQSVDQPTIGPPPDSSPLTGVNMSFREETPCSTPQRPSISHIEGKEQDLIEMETISRKSLVRKSEAQRNVNEYLRLTCLQLLEITAISATHNWMVTLLRELLHGKGSGDEAPLHVKERRKISLQHCEKLMAMMKEILLQAEEKDGRLIQHANKKNLKVEELLVQTLVTISLFSAAHPPLVSPHLSTLIPYLKGDSSLSPSQNSLMVLQIIKTMTSVAMIYSVHLVGINVHEIIEDLVAIALKQTMVNVDASIRCLAVLISRTSKDASPFFRLFEKCFNAVRMISMDDLCSSSIGRMSMAQLSRLQRCLIVLGSLCRHAKICFPALLAFANQFNDQYLSSPSPTSTSPRSNSSKQLDTTPATSPTGGAAAATASLRSLGISMLYLQHTFPLIDEKIASFPLKDIEYCHPKALYGAVYAVAYYALSIQSIPSLNDPLNESNQLIGNAIEQVHLRAVQCLCGVFVGCPRLLIISQSNGLLDRLFQISKPSVNGLSNFSEEVRRIFLVSIADMMKSDEVHNEDMHALTGMRDAGVVMKPPQTIDRSVVDHPSKRVLGSIDIEQDISMAGSVLQRYLPDLIPLLSHPNVTLRGAALQLLGTLLKQGMVCPMDVIPTLIALQGDTDPFIRSDSLHMLEWEDERHPSFLDNRIVSGIELATTFRIQSIEISPHDPSHSIESNLLQWCTLDPASNFAAFYHTCVASNRKRVHEVIYGLLRKVMSIHAPTSRTALLLGRDSPNGSASTSTRLKDHLQRYAMGSWMIQILASFPCETVEEPLRIIDWINRNVTIDINALLNQSHRALQQIGLSSIHRSIETVLPSPSAGILSPSSGTKPPSSGSIGGMMPPPMGKPSKALSTLNGSKSHIKKGMFEGLDGLYSIDFDVMSRWIDGLVIHQQFVSSMDKKGDGSEMGTLLQLMDNVMELRSKVILIRLRGHLKRMYQIDDEKLGSFHPNDKTGSFPTIALDERGTGAGVRGETWDWMGVSRSGSSGRSSGRSRDEMLREEGNFWKEWMELFGSQQGEGEVRERLDRVVVRIGQEVERIHQELDNEMNEFQVMDKLDAKGSKKRKSNRGDNEQGKRKDRKKISSKIIKRKRIKNVDDEGDYVDDDEEYLD